MIEPIFKVSFEKNLFQIEAENQEAKDFENEFFNRTKEIDATIPLIKFILMSPNTMEMDKEGNLIYELDLTVKEEIFTELFEKINKTK